jgi:pheromone shutdown protein TraB
MPRKIIVIGTLHAGITPNNELKEVIESFKPDQLLVEINNDDIVKNDLSSYPPEMIFAFEWAKSNNVKVAGFDSTIDVFREGVTPENNQAIIEKQKKLIKKLSWKDFNKIKNEKLLDVDGMDELTDKDKESAREVEMLKNIKANIIESGTVVLITGTAHLNFFERTIKDAIFPFRNSHSNNV